MYRWVAWNILFRAHEKIKGHPTHRILREMEAADRLSSTELAKLQAGKLREFLRYSYTHVPYVRARMQEAGLTPEQISDARDLIHLPLITKAEMRSHRASFRSDSGAKFVPFTT